MFNTKYLHPLSLGRSLAIVMLVLCFGLAAFAQGAGDLSGVITDATGAVVPRVNVTLTNDATGISRTTESTAAGVYRFTSLPIVGTYTLKTEAKGFRVVTIKNIVVSVGTTISQDIVLQIGAAGETVSVEAGTQLVQTTESSVSTLVDQRIWQQMPLEVRNQNSFIELVAGVTPDDQAGSTRGASVNGARGGAGNYMVEGMDNNDQGQGGRGQLSGYDAGGAVTSISPEAIQEYRVITNTFAAEYGKAGGFVTDTVLKSGTNKWHGSLFEYNRVQALAANHYFSNREGLKDSLVRNQFGGSVGGPIKKEKAFFYFATEQQRARESSPLTATGTTQQFLDFVNGGQMANFLETSPNGACNNQAFLDYTFGPGTAVAAPCPGGMAHSRTLGSTFNGLRSKWGFPLATSQFSSGSNGYYTSADPANGFAGISYPVPVYGQAYVINPYHLNEYRYSGKVDYRLSNNDSLNGMLLWQHAESGDPFSANSSGGNPISQPYTNEGVSINSGITWNHTFTPTILNSAKFSYLRHRSDFPSPEGLDGVPMIVTYNDPMGVGFGNYAGSPQFFTDNQFQFQDSLAIMRGKHAFKMGGEYRRIRNGSRFFNDYYGTFEPWAVEDLVTDLYFTQDLETALGINPANGAGSVGYTSAAVDPTTGKQPNVYRGFRANELAFYLQDDWRLKERLTVNFGIRYEYFGPPHNYQPGIDSNFYFGSPITPVATTSTNPYFPKNNPYYARVAGGNFQVRDNEIWNKDTNNFAPRLGLSWDVLGTQKLVLRAGAGIMYDRIWNNLFENIRFNPPYYSDNQVGNQINGVPIGPITNPGLYTVPFTSTAFYSGGARPAVPNPRHMDQNLVSPYYEQFHLGFQWEFAKGYMFEPEYISTLGHKLTAYRDINTFNGRMVAGLGNRRINPNVGADNYRSNEYSSNYHALQMTVRKSFSKGFSFNSSYTWSKALDTISDAFNSRQAATVTDPMNIKNDYGPADFYMKHRFVTNFSYDLPFMKNSRWLGGWGINSIIAIQSGVPFTPWSSSSSYDLNKNGVNSDRYVPFGAAMDTLLTGGSPADGYIDATKWKRGTCATGLQWCDAAIGRNSVIGPGFANVDFNVTKAFKVNERASFKFQANFFNLFNRANFATPTSNATSSTFGQSTSTYDPRVTQLALRFDF
jgi:outer membrane receptor for ferrienterochelin and colicin